MRKLCCLASMLILSLSFVLILMNCFQSKNPLGADHEIRVVADSTIWQQTEPVLREIFEKVEYTPQPEKVFKLVKADLNNFKRFKNIIFLSTIDAKDEISKSINSNLSEDARGKVEAGNIIFVKRNEWVSYQMIMFLIGKDLPSLLNGMDEQRSEIFFQFDNYWNEFHKDILYHYKEKKDIEQHLLQNYGWMIRVPNDFFLEIQSAKDRFVMFQRKIPLRWLSVYWVEATDPTIITKEWCIAKRNEIGKIFYEGESVEEKYEEVRVEELVFLNRRALKLKGLWKNADDAMDPAGGPFRLYCFFDEPTERIYFIDMHLFYPEFKKRKLHYFRQMEIIANTFKTNLEISPGEL
jgi:hypothetical protein